MRLSFALVIFLAGCAPSVDAPVGWSRVSAADFATELAAGSPTDVRRTIVDVREPDLFRQGHIPGALNLPFPAAKLRAPAELDSADRIVFVCHRGPMGDELARILVARGFRHVRNLAGGMAGWSGPVERGP
jgi:rhodanese-related sulfurtransferase